MASLHTVQQVQLQKPLAQSSTRGKWNSMHARIARYIQEQQNKNKVKKRKSSLSNRLFFSILRVFTILRVSLYVLESFLVMIWAGYGP